MTRINPYGRLRLANRYVWLAYNEYCGPSFSWDRNFEKPYEPKDQTDPIWPEFQKWLKKYEATKQLRSEK